MLSRVSLGHTRVSMDIKKAMYHLRISFSSIPCSVAGISDASIAAAASALLLAIATFLSELVPRCLFVEILARLVAAEPNGVCTKVGGSWKETGQRSSWTRRMAGCELRCWKSIPVLIWPSRVVTGTRKRYFGTVTHRVYSRQRLYEPPTAARWCCIVGSGGTRAHRASGKEL